MGIASAIRHIATSKAGRVFAAALFEHEVSIWDFETGTKVSEFQSTLDYGGRRLAITNSGEFVVVGSYERFGVAAYRSYDGFETWRRRDLKKVQHINVSTSDDVVYCCFDSQPCRALSIVDGITQSELRGVRRIDESSFEPIRLIDKNSLNLQTSRGTAIGEIRRETFAILDAAFTPDRLVLTESGGAVRCFSTTDCQELWRHDWPPGTHALRLGFNQKTQAVVAVTWEYTRGGPYKLIVIDAENGAMSDSVELNNAWSAEFCANDTRLITSNGDVLDTSNCKQLLHIKFPTKEYAES